MMLRRTQFKLLKPLGLVVLLLAVMGFTTLNAEECGVECTPGCVMNCM